MTATEDGPDPGEGVEELTQLLVDKFVLGLVGQVRSQYPNLGSAGAEDAVCAAVENVLKRLAKGPLRDVRGYLATVAFNEANKASRRAAREVASEERPDDGYESPEDSVLRDLALGIFKAEIGTWENAHIREVMLVYVDVIAYGEPLESDDVAEIVSAALGEEVSAGSVRQWKARGMKRLLAFVNEKYDRAEPYDDTEE